MSPPEDTTWNQIVADAALVDADHDRRVQADGAQSLAVLGR